VQSGGCNRSRKQLYEPPLAAVARDGRTIHTTNASDWRTSAPVGGNRAGDRLADWLAGQLRGDLGMAAPAAQ